MTLPSLTSTPIKHGLADPDSIPDSLPVTKRMHERIVTEDGVNPQGRTMRALLAAIGELEAAIQVSGQKGEPVLSTKGATDA